MEGTSLHDDAHGGAQDILTPQLRNEIRLARRCFSQLERMATLQSTYPAGHPVVESALEATFNVFKDFFELTDRLSVEVRAHSLIYLKSDEVVWETKDPKDYCFLMSRDGIFLLHFLAGLQPHDLRRFVEVLNDIVRPENYQLNVVVRFFEAAMRYVAYEALDESLAALAGLAIDLRDRDTRQEREEIEELFEQAFKRKEDDEEDDSEKEYEVNVRNPDERFRKMELGSREFLTLDDDARQKLWDLRDGFTEHRELEHREGEMLSAILGAKPRTRLRELAVEQIGEVMGGLLQTPTPWEALAFLKLIHHWRDRFDKDTVTDLRDVVVDSFNDRRIASLIKQLVSGGTEARRPILQMFNALHLDRASTEVVRLIGWGLQEEARDDLLRYVRERARYGMTFIEPVFGELPGETIEPVMDIVQRGMPRTRHMFIDLLQGEVEPQVRVKALHILRGSWQDQTEVRRMLLPLIKGTHSESRVVALESFAEVMPGHVTRVLEPMFEPSLRKRPEEEVRTMVNLFVVHGGADAVEKLRSLVQRRGVIGEDDRELAVTIAQSLIKTPRPEVVDLLNTVAKDWLVSPRIRSICKEIAGLLQSGR